MDAIGIVTLFISQKVLIHHNRERSDPLDYEVGRLKTKQNNQGSSEKEKRL